MEWATRLFWPLLLTPRQLPWPFLDTQPRRLNFQLIRSNITRSLKCQSWACDYSMEIYQLFDARHDVKNNARHGIDWSLMWRPDAMLGIIFWRHVWRQKWKRWCILINLPSNALHVSLECQSWATVCSMKIYHLFDARYDVKKQCQTWHRLLIGVTTRCHIGHGFLTPCLASKMKKLTYSHNFTKWCISTCKH